MFPRLSGRAQNACAHQNFFHPDRSLPCVLLAFALLSACGSRSSVSGTQNASTDLNISGSLPQGSLGMSYKAAVTVTGGTSPYTFSVASGQLPNGVQLAASTGTLSGTPTASGNFNFAVSVSDSSGHSQQKSLQIAVSNNSTSNAGGGGRASSPSSEGSFSNLQRAGGWSQYGQEARLTSWTALLRPAMASPSGCRKESTLLR